MTAIINNFFTWPISNRLRAPDSDDEHVDRLNHRVTVGVILTCVLVATTTSFFRSPISCWLPAQLKREKYPRYIEDYCWISNTYYIHSDVDPPDSDDERKQAQIGYYQWVPVLLFFMALFFYAPRLFWRSFNIRCGIDVQYLIKRSQSVNRNAQNAASKIVDYYCQAFQSTEAKSSVSLGACARQKKRQGNYLSSIYFFTRLFYSINSICQLILLNVLLGHRGNAWLLDIDVIKSILRHGNPLLDSPYFPRVTLCDVPIRELGEIHRYTIQCTLPINMINEKIFLILSFWFTYLVIYNIFSFIMVIRQQLRRQRINFIKRLMTFNESDESDLVEDFTVHYLSYDGVFLLRLLTQNANELQAMEVTKLLYEKYIANRSISMRQ